MKTRLFAITFLAIASLMAFGQRPNIELTFTAENNGTYVQLDSIKVMNRTQGGDTVLYWPDTMLLALYYVGIPENNKATGEFQVFQNYPNPVAGHTTISFFIPEKDQVSLAVSDMLGRVILQSERVLDKGSHSFRFTPGSGHLYFFTAHWRGHSGSIKILQAGQNAAGTGSLEYVGSEDSSPQLKAIQTIQGFFFIPGDTLLYIGYSGGMESGMLDAPQESTTYTFQFATNIPCPGTPMVEYAGQVYNTIQVFSQCWLKENLNVGTMILGTIEQSNNETIEKYCYNNDLFNCNTYGGLYQWDEMMQYTTQQGTQGICPPGWHLPTDEEWKVLEGAVDSQYGIGDPEWDLFWEYRGYDAGTNLKTISGWWANGNGTDLYGFSGLPGGHRGNNSNFGALSMLGRWWPSSEQDDGHSWHRDLSCDYPEAGRAIASKENGYSVRCLRDEPFSAEVPTVTTAEVTFVTQTSAVCGGNVVADGGAYVTARGVVWSTAEHPTIENNEGITYNGSGTGQYVSQLTGLNPETEYFVRAYATNSQGTNYGEDQGFITNPAGFICGTSTITDIDGNVYNTVLIGDQCWMKETLRVGTMIAGGQNQSNNGTIEKYCYDNLEINCHIYGGLYQWDEAMQYSTQQGMQGICPPGWHIPTDAEWTAFTNYVISNPDYWCNNNPLWIAKSLAATTNWITSTNTCAIGNDMAANNATGFTALPGGWGDSDGSFYSLDAEFHWRSSTAEHSSSEAWTRDLYYWKANVDLYGNGKLNGFSLRCLRN